MEQNTIINRMHKDRLFKMVFSEENKAFELYCAIRNINGKLDEANLEFDTIDDAIFMKTKNDLSFCCFNDMNFFEQQSTYNANEPLRLLIYYGQVISAYVKTKGIDIFSSSKIPQKIPNPRIYVIYCGEQNEEAVQNLRLSDAFFDKEGDVEVTVHMYNICAVNDLRINDLLAKSPSLAGYAYFVKTVRRRKNNGERIEDAIEHTIDDCIKRGCLVEILEKHRSEVLNVVLTEYNEEEHIRHEKQLSLEEGIKKGIEKGIEKGKICNIIDSVYEGDITLERAHEKAAKVSNMSARDFDVLLIQYHPDYVFSSCENA